MLDDAVRFVLVRRYIGRNIHSPGGGNKAFGAASGRLERVDYMQPDEIERERVRVLASLADRQFGRLNTALDSRQGAFQIGAAVVTSLVAAFAARGQVIAIAFLPLPLGVLLVYQLQVYA